MNVQQTAVQRAIAFLNAAGASYRIELGDESFTNMPIKVKKYVKSGVSFKPIYQPMVETLTKEKYGKFVVPIEVDLVAFRAALASTLSKKFGQGNTITQLHRDTRTIEVICVGNLGGGSL